ncbi:MAG: hypothetical protein Q9207_003057 [Kuettlingeria erythrocarpa]
MPQSLTLHFIPPSPLLSTITQGESNQPTSVAQAHSKQTDRLRLLHLAPTWSRHPRLSRPPHRLRCGNSSTSRTSPFARKTSAGEDSDSATEDIPDSDSNSDSAQPDMATSPANIRESLSENYMFIERGYLNHPDNGEFKDKVMKVTRSDRKSAVSEKDSEAFEKTYKTYKLTNEATLTHFLIPVMVKTELTAQDCNQDSEPYGEFKTRDFIDQGVRTALNELFAPYCLPHALMNRPEAPRSMTEDHFNDTKALTTPKPDFVYGLSEDALPKAPSDIKVSKAISSLLKVAPIRDVFFVWENKSGGGILMKCENDAVRDVSAIIYAKRQLYEYLGRANEPGIDKQTFVYAATNDNRKLDIWVAYAWMPEDLSRVEFHMEKIGSIDFSMDELEQDPNTLANIRKPLHNIIEWGSIARIPELRRFYDELWEVERGVFNRALEKAREEEAREEAESSKKKKKKTS